MPQMNLSTKLYEPVDWNVKADEHPVNPYEVSITANATGPDGTAFELPGFYKKQGVWCVRFSAPSAGTWNLQLKAPLPSLSGRTVTVCVGDEAHGGIHGVLRIHPHRPKHFQYQDGTPYFLMGYELNWLWAVDQEQDDISHVEKLLDALQEGGFNQVFLNAYAYDTSWRLGHTTEFDYGPPKILPWPGEHGDHDYSRLNEAYFEHYDRIMHALYVCGMEAHIYLKVYNKLVIWPEKYSREEELFFDAFVARYQAYPNVIWDFSKESYYEPDKDYIAYRLQRVKSLDAYKHLVTIHDDKRFSFHPDTACLIDFVTDQNHWDLYHTVIYQHSVREVPIVNEEFGYEHALGEVNGGAWGWTHTPLEVVERAYEVVMAGGYPAHYYTNHAWDIVKWDEVPAALDAFRSLKELFTSLDWTALIPRPELVRQHAGRCLMSPDGEVMLLYAPKGKTNLNADWLSPVWTGFWMNIWSGERIEAKLRLQPGGSGDLEAPFKDRSAIGYFRISK